MMQFINEIDNIWKQNKGDFDQRLSSWASALTCGLDTSLSAKKEFHQWDPLKTYISVSKSKSNTRAIYSLRFFGQEVAHLVVKNREVRLHLKGHEKKNREWFGVEIKDGNYLWRGKEAKEFRACFKNISRETNGFPKVRSPEHRVETKFIAEMCKGSGKFGTLGLQIQPVMIAGKFPLQIPVPISANTGKPKAGNGYIDILSRRKAEDNKVRLSVWELKRPGEYQHAASQACIYAYTILQILRKAKSSNEWYKLFGFKSKIPKSLTIEAVVAITRDQRKKFLKEKETIFSRNTVFAVGGDHIKLYDAYYQEKTNSIELEQNPFLEKI